MINAQMAHVSGNKKKVVENLTDLIKSKKTILMTIKITIPPPIIKFFFTIFNHSYLFFNSKLVWMCNPCNSSSNNLNAYETSMF